MSTVLFDVEDSLATITLNRPERLNAITSELVDDLSGALRVALRTEAVRAIVLTGAGDRAFCAGDDLGHSAAMPPDRIRAYVERIQEVSRLIIFGDKPVVAAVNGWAVGGGFEWVMGCDLSIWAETARGFMPEVSLGLGVTGGVVSLLPRLVGWQRARALLYFGEKHSAHELREIGLAHAVVPLDQLRTEARRAALKLATLPAAALGGLKRALGQVHRDEIERALAAEAELVARLVSDPAVRARMAALASKS
jgi:enoyl-CoA hydratase/carnithine racemase